MFYEVQDLLDKGRVSGHNAVAPTRHVYLLSGLLHCGECFEKMNAMSAKKSAEKRYHWYTCANQACSVGTIPADKIEKTVIDTLTELAFKREVLTAIIDEANARLAADIPRLKKELKARQNSLRKVSDRIRTLIYSHAEVDGDAQKLIAEELGKHSKRKVELETSIAGLEGRIAGCSSNRVVTEAVVAVLDRFTSSIRVLNPLERKKLLESVLAKVYWDGKNGLRIGMHGNHALGASEVLTGNGKFGLFIIKGGTLPVLSYSLFVTQHSSLGGQDARGQYHTRVTGLQDTRICRGQSRTGGVGVHWAGVLSTLPR
ncbi:MAG: zinc ribbon domain-containing protein [Candidatus Fermentibacteraceae bacterium]